MLDDPFSAGLHVRPTVVAGNRNQRDLARDVRLFQAQCDQFGIVQMQRVEAGQDHGGKTVARQRVQRLGVLHPIRDVQAQLFRATGALQGLADAATHEHRQVTVDELGPRHRLGLREGVVPPDHDHDLVVEQMLVTQRSVAPVRFAHADAQVGDAVAHRLHERAVRRIGQCEAQHRLLNAQRIEHGQQAAGYGRDERDTHGLGPFADQLRHVIEGAPSVVEQSLGQRQIGLFVTMLGLRNAGMVAVNAKTSALALGDFSRPGALVTLIGLAVAIMLQARKVPGAILLAILAAALAGVPLGVTRVPETLISLPHAIGPVAFQLDIGSALSIAAAPYLFAFFAAEFFSTLGTALAVGAKANLLDEHGNLPDIHRPFLVDSIAATLGPLLGIPALTALVESAAGAEAGARTGLSSLAAAAMFALMLLFVPVALAIPKEATAPALILIGLSMFSTIRHAHFDDFTDALPVMLMVLLTLVSNSFGTGIAGGLLCYVLIKLLAGRWREVPWGLMLLAVPLGYYFWTVVKPH